MSTNRPTLPHVDSRLEELSRALAFIDHVDDGVASAVRDWRLGRALITPELPRVWDANYLRVERSADGAERVAAEALAIAREAELAYCAIVITDDATAAGLGRSLRSAGFEEVRFAVMALREPPRAPDIAITDVSFDDVAPSRRQIALESFPGDEALADQLNELDRRLEATIGGRWFGIRDGTEVVARAWLLGSGGVGQVEDVATSPGHRGRGLGRAVVSAAARASLEVGNELTFVTANDGATTTELYRKVGFERVGFRWRFVRRLQRPGVSRTPRAGIHAPCRFSD